MSSPLAKPPFGPMRRAHRLASHALAVWPALEGGGSSVAEFVEGNRFFGLAASHVSWAPTPHGAGVRVDGSVSPHFITSAAKLAIPAASPMTVFWFGRIDARAGSFPWLMQPSDSGPTIVGGNGTSQQLYATRQAGVAVPQAGTFALGQWFSFVATHPGGVGTMRVYVDGVLSNSASVTAADQAGFIQYGSRSSTQHFNSTASIWGVVLREWSAADVMAWHADPFAAFRPPSDAGVAAAWIGESVGSDVVGASLSQSDSAGFEERPRGGSVGLRVELTEGGRGAILERDLAEPRARLHTRFVLRPVSVEGGWVDLIAGRDADDAQTFSVRFDPALGRVSARLTGGPTLIADLPPAMDWRCVEFAIDADAGEAALWLNGVRVDHASGDLSALATRTLWFGAPHKAIATTGELHLDEWAIADGYIGPVTVEPIGDHADDPARWLVVYNRLDADSCAWAAAYRQRRGVPLANLVGLDLPLDEIIGEAEFVAMRDAIAEYRSVNRLDAQIVGVLLGHGVPGGYVRPDLQVEPTAGQLERPDNGTEPTTNPLAATDAASIGRPTVASLAGDLLTARIDAASLDPSIAMLDRAASVEAAPLVSGGADGGTIWLDPYAPAGSLYALRRDQMIAWAGGLDRQRLRLPIRVPDDPAPSADAEFESIDGDAFFWGWDRATPPAGFFASPAGRRVFAIQLRFSGATGGSLRPAGDDSWAAAMLDAGYAAFAFSPRSITSSAVPRVEPFFEALRRGWTIAEAWRVACPLLRSGLALVGDPLMTVAMPRAGWDAFGPFESLDRAAFNEPIAHLRPAERQLALAEANRPTEGESPVYVVRRVDDQGRAEAGVRLVRITRVDGQSLPTPIEPCWPIGPGWSPPLREGSWRIVARWPDRCGRCGVASVELIGQVQGDDEQIVATAAPSRDASTVSFTRPAPESPTRYRLRTIGAAGGVLLGPWSRWMTPDPASSATLTLI